MNLIALTINHRTAPIEVREALHLSREEIIDVIPLFRKNLLSEGFILSTCNRTEIFGFYKERGIDFFDVVKFLTAFKNIDGIKNEHFERFFSCGAVKHLFNICAGLDSLIVGDSQILSQAKEAFQIAEDSNFSGNILQRLFDFSIKVGKRAITESEIGEGAVTISYAAVQVIEKIFTNISNKRVLVIGAGQTGELAAEHIKDKGAINISLANRTKLKAEKVAKKIGVNVIEFEQVKNKIFEYDIIISATSSPDYIIQKEDVLKAMKNRRQLPICFMDIALPRDIEPEIANIDNVFYHNIDSLNIIVEENLERRKKEIPIVEKIIMEEMINFFGWYNTLNVVPSIKSFRDFFEEMKNDELEKIKNKITEEDFKKVESMTKRLMGRILHNPTMRLRELAESGTNNQDVKSYINILNDLFNLNNKNEEKDFNE